MVDVIDISNMTLRDIDNAIRINENQLDYYLNEKERAFIKTQPKITQIRKEKIVASGYEDKMLKYVMTIEELNNIIDGIQDRIANLKQLFEAETKRIGEYEPLIQKIINMRNRGYKWVEIADATKYCESNCRRLYSKYMKKRDVY